MLKLTAKVHELEEELHGGEFDYYSTVADLLAEAHTQSNTFDSYAAVPHIAQINAKIAAIESELKRQLGWTFRELGIYLLLLFGRLHHHIYSYSYSN